MHGGVLLSEPAAFPAPRLLSIRLEPVSKFGDDSGRFFPTSLIFPTSGCWEVTGRVGEIRLTFVTLVVMIGEGPNWQVGVAP